MTCSTECFNKRRAIRARNKTRLTEASKYVLRAVGELTPWPDLQLELISMVSALKSLDDEVTSSQMELEHQVECVIFGLGPPQEEQS